jgi:hypothetical protein
VRPRWKILAEMAAGLVFMISGAWALTRAFDGGPSWYWGGIFSLVYGIRLFQTNWKVL